MPSNFSLKLKILNLTSIKNLNYWHDTEPETQIIKLSPEKNEIIIKNKGEARFFYFTEETSTYSYGFNHHLKFYDFQNHFEEEIYPKSYQAFYPIKSARSNWNKSGLTHLNVREPHSGDLLKWIKKNALFFDHLIIHGCTFKINHAVANMFQENKISYSVIPHFHQDDKFYFLYQ